MNAKEAVAARIIALCDERGITINALAGLYLLYMFLLQLY